KYATFTGRARRKEYWLFILFNIIIGFVFALIETVIGMEFGLSKKPISAIYALIMFIPGIAVTVRRLHDTGRSGYWILGNILPFIFLLLSAYLIKDFSFDNPFFKGILVVMPIIIMTITGLIVFYFLCLDSQSGDNQYGSNPKVISTFKENVVPLPIINDNNVKSKVADNNNAKQVNITSKADMEELFWAKALTEYESDNRRPGVWAKMFSEAQGNEALAKANYLQQRYKDLSNEHAQSILAQAPAATPVVDPIEHKNVPLLLMLRRMSHSVNQ
ncbi:MAG: hypothetical protein RI956_275, partial [Pseudomonadota bacterium]